MKTRPVLWSLALAAAVVLAGCNKHNTNDNDTMQPGANTAPAASAPATTPDTAPTGTMPPATGTTPATSGSAMMPPPTAPATSGSSGH